MAEGGQMVTLNGGIGNRASSPGMMSTAVPRSAGDGGAIIREIARFLCWSNGTFDP
jgi:hypothetical protein